MNFIKIIDSRNFIKLNRHLKCNKKMINFEIL